MALLRQVDQEFADETNIGVRRLILTQFRNHARFELENIGKISVLYGPNGAGKTNILEAISLLNSGRGIRSAEIGELSRMGEDGGAFAVSALLGDGIDERKIGLGLDINAPSPRKIARLNGKDVSAKALSDSLRIIWLTPQMDRIFASPQSERRKFLDRLVLSFYPEVQGAFSDYEKLIRERQKILENENPDNIWLNAIEEQVSSHAIAIANARVEAIGALQTEIDNRIQSPFPKAQLLLDGFAENAILDGLDLKKLEIEIAKNFKDYRTRDQAVGRSLFGTHKTSFAARHLGNNMMAEKCSTGEQKALIIGLIIAQAKLVSQGLQSGVEGYFNRPNPVILLDEAFAHLDDERRQALSGELANLRSQSWLTGTDKELFSSLNNKANFYAISPNCAQITNHNLEQ